MGCRNGRRQWAQRRHSSSGQKASPDNAWRAQERGILVAISWARKSRVHVAPVDMRTRATHCMKTQHDACPTRGRSTSQKSQECHGSQEAIGKGSHTKHIRGAKSAAQWEKGVWLGSIQNSDGSLIGTPRGLIISKSVAPQPESQHFDIEVIGAVRATPLKP